MTCGHTAAKRYDNKLDCRDGVGTENSCGLGLAMMKYVDGAGWGKIDGDGVGTAKIHRDGLVIGTVYYIVSVSIMFRRSEVHSSYSRFTALRIIKRIFLVICA